MSRRAATVTALAALGVAVAAPVAAKPPASGGSLTITSSHSTVTYGKSVVISGHLTSSPNAGQQITLQQNPFPFTGFSRVANATTDAAGNYAFTVKPTVITRYRTVGKGKNAPTSPEQLVNVRLRVGLRVGDTTPARGKRVRFSGTVLPAKNGRAVAIQRRTSSGWKTVATTTLVDAGNGASKYSRRVKIRRSGRYRAKVPGDASIKSGKSRRIRIRVH
jgi:hypothetical protein